MLTKQEYDQNKDSRMKMVARAKQDPMHLSYHLMPPAGWLNDPNGLCELDGVYHIYYQYSPLDANMAQKIWGHYTTTDFITYQEHEPFLYADDAMDADGVYSGSCYKHNNELYFYYTGNVKYKDKEYDYINEGREHNTILVTSKDGYKHSSKQLILSNDDYPQTMTKHVRDPKIFAIDGIYYMVLGARDKDKGGCCLVYKSTDLEHFSYYNTIYPQNNFGYMWECPDLIELDNSKFLICCPQGVEQQPHAMQNVYQNGYFSLEYDFAHNTYNLGEFIELDYGFDFYAPQTFIDDNNRTIMWGWMGMPDASYTNPTTKNDWQHCLTIPREIINQCGKLYQRPLKELEQLRKNHIQVKNNDFSTLPNTHCYEIIMEVNNQEFEMHLRSDVTLTYKDNLLTLSLGTSGYGRDKRYLELTNLDNLQIFSDTSSIEIFINDGAYTMSTRVYAQLTTNDLSITTPSSLSIDYYELQPIIVKGEA